MPTQMEIEPIARQLPVRASTPMDLMRMALENGQVEQLQILQDMHFKQMERDAEIEFNQAMNQVQAKIGRVAPDLNNPQTSSKYASYKALDKFLRPIYTEHGISLSFSEEDCPKENHVRIICYVSRGLHTRVYRKDKPVDNKGIKGNVMMTPMHATASADSYGKRYLLKDIFNVAIGEDDTDGNSPHSTFRIEDYDELQERIAHFDKLLDDKAALEEHWRNSRAWAKSKKDQDAVDRIDAKKDECKQKMKAGEK